MQGHFWKNFPGARAPESRGVATAETSARGADAGGGIAGSRPRAPGNEQAGYLQVKTNAMKKKTGQTYCLTC